MRPINSSKKTSLNFIGNIEGRDLFTNKVNIAVCDGFVGNIALKLCEGLGKSFSKALKKRDQKGHIYQARRLFSKTCIQEANSQV